MMIKFVMENANGNLSRLANYGKENETIKSFLVGGFGLLPNAIHTHTSHFTR